jgi:hypothetical protein
MNETKEMAFHSSTGTPPILCLFQVRSESGLCQHYLPSLSGSDRSVLSSPDPGLLEAQNSEAGAKLLNPECAARWYLIHNQFVNPCLIHSCSRPLSCQDRAYNLIDPTRPQGRSYWPQFSSAESPDQGISNDTVINRMRPRQIRDRKPYPPQSEKSEITLKFIEEG